MAPDEIYRAVEPIKDDARLLAEELQTLDEMLELLKADGRPEADFLPVLEHVRHFFLTDLMRHLQEEERDFFPAVEKLPEGYWKKVRLRKEHAELREAIERFRSSLTLEHHVGWQTQQQLLWRLVNEARAILSLLRAHAMYEVELTRELQAAVAPPIDSSKPPV